MVRGPVSPVMCDPRTRAGRFIINKGNLVLGGSLSAPQLMGARPWKWGDCRGAT